MNIVQRSSLCACLIVAAAGSLAAQTTSGPCETGPARQFDFWLGTWEVRDTSGERIGMSTIDSVMNGCAIHETWKSGGPPEGRSYSVYDAPNGRWHQTYIDSRGALLLLSGHFEDGAMMMTGARVGSDGAKREHRIRWTPQPDGSVMQHYEISEDDGVTWNVAFDGHYQRVSPPPGSSS